MSIDLTPSGPTAEAILAEARDHGVALFGAGGFARAVAGSLTRLGITVRAFVVTSPSAASCDGIPVRPLAELGTDFQGHALWVAVFNREAHSDLAVIRARCQAATGVAPVLPQHYYGLLSDSLGWRFWLSDRSAYLAHQRAISDTLGRLEDDTSQRLYRETIAFRLGRDVGPPQPDDGTQYFPEFFARTLPPTASFVDGGAFDGDTIVDALRHVPTARVFAFEPDPANFAALAARVSGLSAEVTCYPCGLSDRTRFVTCRLEQGEACAVDASGNDVMHVVALDDALYNIRIDLLKLDVEGHEQNALEGAAATIARWRPNLAIAGYHLWDDLWRIPATILKLYPGYRLAYRIHGHNTFDAVFYAYQ